MTRSHTVQGPDCSGPNLSGIDWDLVGCDLARDGHARFGPILAPDDCYRIRGWFDDDAMFRKTVDMTRHGYGQGAYRYFADPLPPVVRELRERLYAPIAPMATAMDADLKLDQGPFPDSLPDYRARCAESAQPLPTPLLLRYGAGGYNCLHRDLYGDLWFPLQAVIMLSEEDVEFTGGEFLLVEQRPRQQSAGMVLRPKLGECILFPVFARPVMGRRGPVRRQIRHGVSTVRSGHRTTLGIIFHDAKS